MEQRTGEALSALMDQEADDIDLQRVLNSVDGEEGAAATWRRYHLASAAMHHELGVFSATDLSSRIREQLDHEPWLPEASVSERSSGWLRPLAGVAVAASVTAVILTSTQLYQSTIGTTEPPVARVASQGNVSNAVSLGGSLVGGPGNPMQYASAMGELAVATGTTLTHSI